MSDPELLAAVIKILKNKGCSVGSRVDGIWIDVYECSYRDIKFSLSLDEDYGFVEIRVGNPEDRSTLTALFG